ncbi:MAG: peptidylprolyl isomerase [Candidatus Harrisonbacteria bacterium CG10_big_fil_rev_8_21_14_0_10_44_23]|uniref:Peptidyl-prolyl cis-trans isomerase n=1 Tax=Candidatus Harrisonbacteria bacterium CG10_big_fil_rev_8_21_14_0_10_44_23 TaxID=1974585 RepID=A0A2H0UQ35_9BACT|nr:MAG: peptidylprolyl isomerase [Candidatus Harrisonbacteria bacterium CG10_big_fil_rev_8_21_14_0_10_44_23]
MEAQTIKQDNGLEITTLKAGTGEGAVVGNSVTVHYVGTLTNGAKFDSSRDHNQPFTVVLGQNRVIPGWEQGLLGIKAGELRKLVIPSDLAYGPQELPGIPANSTLVFEIEALEIK